MTPIEKKFWNTYQDWKDRDETICNRLGYDSIIKIVPQYQLKVKGKRIVVIDFAEPDIKIAIELDGHKFHRTKSQNNKRERAIILEDFVLLRYTGSEVWNDPIEVLAEIYHTYCLRIALERGVKNG